MNIFKFWIHLENQPPDSIAKLCLNKSDKMAKENKSGLINKIDLLSTQLDMLTLKTLLLSYPKLRINHQLNLIRTNKKLKFYSIFKNEANQSEFINHIWNPEHRRVASKFRIGNHNLKIETGRFTIPKTPEALP